MWQGRAAERDPYVPRSASMCKICTELGNALPVCLCSQAAGDSRALLAPSRPQRLPPAPVLGVMDVPSLAAQQDRAASLAAGQLLAQGIFAGKDHHEDLFLISPAEFQLTLNVP